MQDMKEERFYLKCRSFVDAVAGGLPAPIPTSQIIYNQAIIDGIVRSCECGHEVELDV
jgi:predicted dehydrogenase